MLPPDNVSETVRHFYEELPFNYCSSTADACRDIKQNPISAYPDLEKLLTSGNVTSILEIGCGVGWLSNSISYHYGLPVQAIDLANKAVERAKAVSKKLRTTPKAQFQVTDLYQFKPTAPVDLMISIGVLPSVADSYQAFKHMIRFLKPGGHIYLGLYHYFGRKIFRAMFDEILKNNGKAFALEKYKAMHSRLKDDTLILSWFRDQVLHPHEAWHTLEEVCGWFTGTGFRLESTSINRFQKINEPEALFELEKTYEQLSYQANYIENRYFPGFFTVLGQKQKNLRIKSLSGNPDN